MTSIQLTSLPDCPNRLNGDVASLDRDQPLPERGSPIYLCRCGRSADKPFCDRAHARTGWTEDA
jgi:CDGSH-type Zn-finger protein